jgi:hypothetical protein
MRRKSMAPLFREAKSEGWATRKIRGKIERSLRVGHPPVVMSATFEVYSERSATGGHRRFHRNVGKSML